MMTNFISTQSWSRSQLQDILDFATSLKESPYQPLLRNKSVAMLFFNPSLRTKTSFEIGISELEGTAVILQPGKDAWPIEFKDNIEMNGTSEEHVKEVAQVLSSYCDCIAIRAFPAFEDLQEHYGDLQGKDYLLTWTYHPKPLNTAVANSSLLIASKFGMNVKLLCPSEDYLLDERYLNAASQNCLTEGTSFSITHDIESAYSGAEIVYAKSWGSLVHYGDLPAELECRKDFKHFIVDEQKMSMTNNAVFSHCLPLRRNVKATDAVMDADYCLAVQEAANRKHVQKSMLTKIL